MEGSSEESHVLPSSLTVLDRRVGGSSLLPLHTGTPSPINEDQITETEIERSVKLPMVTGGNVMS